MNGRDKNAQQDVKWSKLFTPAETREDEVMKKFCQDTRFLGTPPFYKVGIESFPHTLIKTVPCSVPDVFEDVSGTVGGSFAGARASSDGTEQQLTS